MILAPVDEINSLHAELSALARISVEKAIRIGELLSDQKSKLEHGQWLPWIKANLEFSDQTARNYLRLYERRDESKFKTVLNLTDAYRLLCGRDYEEKERRKAEKKERHTGSLCSDFELHCCDLREAPIKENSIDVIVTDPPYPEEFLPCYEWLAQCASKWLVSGGSAFVMCGHSYLRQILNMLCSIEGFNYNWIEAYLTPGGQSVQAFQRRHNAFWKPVIHMVKGKYTGDWIGDVVKSNTNDNDKNFHHWGQSESGMDDLVERVSLPDQIILDPFCGGGTTGISALKIGRKFIGIDSDPVCIQTSRNRLEEFLNVTKS